MIDDILREAIVKEALTWLRPATPYHITAAIKGAGVDCAQLLYCVYHHVGLMPDMEFDYRSARAFIAEENPLYLETMQKYADEIPEGDCLPGDMIMYKNPKFAIFTHAAIVLGWPNVIHAVHEQGVIVTAMNDGFLKTWERKAFRFRGNA